MNRGTRGFVTFLPGGFEVMMPAIVDWFATQDDSDASEK
jgi:hypothetical protein